MVEKKPWSGRFKEGVDEFLEEFSESISFDHVLAPYEIKASLAYAEALKDAGILSEEEFEAIRKGLRSIERDLKAGKLVFKRELEDIHMNLEKLLYERIGEVAYKLHTGRSRNEQVVTDLRLYLMDKTKLLKTSLKDLLKAIVAKAEEYLGVTMPGFTHLQHAQPVLFSHWIMGYYEMFYYHLQRVQDLEKRLKLCPLGSSAFAGCGFPIDRFKLAKTLGFRKPTRNSVFGVSTRDFVLEVLFVSSLIMLDLSRWAEELVIWTSEEFGFVKLPDRLCTGSSIMPQKKNPDPAELIRGKTGVVVGDLVKLMMIIKALALSYNRDLQEDKPPVFEAIKVTTDSVTMMKLLVEGLTLNTKRLTEVVKSGYLLATELADYLVLKGIPFRKAHHITGEIVKYAESQKKNLEDLSLEEFKNFSELIEEDIYEWLDLEHAINRRNLFGGTGKAAVSEAIATAKKELGM